MADSIDPGRTNPAIPQFVQKVDLHYGADQHFMRKTVAVAFELIDPTHLPHSVNPDTLLTIAVDAATSLAFVMDVIRELTDQQSEIRLQAQSGKLSPRYLPRTQNLAGKARQSLASLRDVEVALKRLTSHFYPKGADNDAWDKEFKPALEARYGDEDGFLSWMNAVWKKLSDIANHRHAMIHPSETKFLKVFDYELRADSAVVAPTIQIAHPQSPVGRSDVAQFLQAQLHDAAEIFEAILGYLCDLNCRQLGEVFESRVTMVPEGQLRGASELTWTTRFLGDFPA